MSGSRIEELLGVFAGVLPDAEVLEQSRTPLNLDALPARAAGVQPELEQDRRWWSSWRSTCGSTSSVG